VAEPLFLPRSKRRFATVLFASVAAVIVGLLPAAHAHAAPAPNAQQIEAQIDALWNQLEPLVEQYNGLHYQLQQNLAKQATLTQQLAPLQMQVDLSMTRVGAISASLYEMGPGSNVAALLSADSPDDFLGQLTAINAMARQQQLQISSTRDQVNAYNKQKAPLDALIQQQQQQATQLAAKKQQIQGQMDQLQKLRTQAYGASGSAPGGVLKPVACPVVYVGGAAGKAIGYACAHIGAPYVWAASGPTNFDCSGLTMAAWAAAGFSLAHFTVTQKQQTIRIGFGDLRPGDLVFYFGDIHHVAIYAGGGWVVHAPHPGDRVRMAKMSEIGSINSYGRVRGS
jgi:cell wall-associated NlpC family hydrolase